MVWTRCLKNEKGVLKLILKGLEIIKQVNKSGNLTAIASGENST